MHRIIFQNKRLHDTCYNSVPSKKNKKNKNERSRKWKYKMSDFSVVSVFNTYVLYTQNFSCFLDIVYFKLRHDNKFSAL